MVEKERRGGWRDTCRALVVLRLSVAYPCAEAPSLVDRDRPRHPSVNFTVVGISASRRVRMEEDLSDRQVRIERATVVGHRVGYRTAILPTHRLPMINGRGVG